MGKGTVISGGTRGTYKADINYSDGTVERRSLWCADLTEDLTGEVATAEIPGDNRIVQILPGYRLLKSQYVPARHGILTYAKDMTPLQATFIGMITPGWQKWYSTYRHGTIKYVSQKSDWCNVLLDVVYSLEQNEILPINQTVYMVNVPIEYMECNAGPFEVGDQVLVEFIDQDWENPVVIGFKEEPKPCTIKFTAHLTNIDSVSEEQITKDNCLFKYIYLNAADAAVFVAASEEAAVLEQETVQAQCELDTPWLDCEAKGLAAYNAKITELYYNKAFGEDGEVVELDDADEADFEGEENGLYIFSADTNSDVENTDTGEARGNEWYSSGYFTVDLIWDIHKTTIDQEWSLVKGPEFEKANGVNITSLGGQPWAMSVSCRTDAYVTSARYRFFRDGVLEYTSVGAQAYYEWPSMPIYGEFPGCVDAERYTVRVDRIFSSVYNHKYKESPPADDIRGGWERWIEYCQGLGGYIQWDSFEYDDER